MKKKTLNLLILNLVITAGIWGAYFYIIHQTRATSASFADMKNKIDFAMKKEQAFANLRKKVEANFNNSFDLKSFLIRPDQTADVVQTIEDFGPMTGTKIMMQTVSTEAAPNLTGGADLLKIVFKIEGSKSDVAKSVALVEALPYNIKINKLSFARSGDATSTLKWSAGVDMILVKLKDAEAPLTQ